mgnify:CR=1 FL=1
MCGIVGGLGLASKEFVNQNYLKLNRRGPDSQNVIHLTNGLSFGAARLAMTDPNPRSNQPMVDPESGDLIVFNGEIYNYKEIRTKLEKSGLVFRTQSDTEVLLKAISKDFLEGCKDLEGMFEFTLGKGTKIIGSRNLTLYLNNLGVSRDMENTHYVKYSKEKKENPILSPFRTFLYLTKRKTYKHKIIRTNELFLKLFPLFLLEDK